MRGIAQPASSPTPSIRPYNAVRRDDPIKLASTLAIVAPRARCRDLRWPAHDFGLCARCGGATTIVRTPSLFPMPAEQSLPSSEPGAADRIAPKIVPAVVQQHAEEAAMLRHVRSVLVRAPHVRLLQLGRLDERIAAHLDGLAVAGPSGTALCVAALESPGAGEVFALAVRALESRDRALLERVVVLAPVLPDARRGLASALGWVSAAQLQGFAQQWLESAQAHERELGVVACRMHRVDPGLALVEAMDDPLPSLRAEALHAAAVLGRVDLLERVCQSMGDDAPEVVLWAAWAACLLGDRQGSLRVLEVAAQQDTPCAQAALALVMAAHPFEAAGDLARRLSAGAMARADDSAARRRLVRAFGLLGDLHFVPWLIERMAEPALARLAGEAFCWICGTDLAQQDLETLDAPPLADHPSDDPGDDDVSLDEDESLPWPDPAKVQAWWQSNHAALTATASGSRLFAGEPVAPPVMHRVLREGTQRMRAQAAQRLCLLQPGTRLFPVAAPAPRQKRLLTAAP
jgi:uncharacterized protein (TIGR02270 family)